MNRTLFSLLLLFLLSACGEKSRGVTGTSVNSTEDKLLADIAAHPDSALLQQTLMQYYRDAGNYDKAIALANQAIRKDSTDPNLRDIAGILYLEKGDTAGSIACYEKAIELNPQPEYVIALGTLYAQTKNPAALDLADGLLLADKANAARPAQFIKGLYYSYSGQKQKAIGYFDACLRLSYTDMDAYLEKSLAQYDLGKYDDALKTLDRALLVDNGFDAGHYYRGRVLEKLGKPAEAAAAYKTALLYDANYAEAKDALAKLGIKN